ncbi:MAG: TIGR03013 family PEP-CTERM/XrtA system glycosyltransferase [Nitrospirota bacterium]|nr:TIGR03013 family PEP-CTERM/XrtA system glycosyltransferase [Nitrospirota bacterium]
MNAMRALIKTPSALPKSVMSELSLTSRRSRVLILGGDQLAKELGQTLIYKSKFRYELVGFLEADSARVGERMVNPGIIGTFDQLHEIVDRYGIGTIAVCLNDRRGGRLPLQMLLDVKAMGVDVVDGHDLYEQESGRLSIDLLKPSTLIFSTGFRRRAVTMGVKRLLDATVSAIGLIVLAPLFAFIAVLIKLESAGPVFYHQTRVGLRGAPYSIWKFRSMQADAEVDGARWAVKGDTRITRVGKWLRKLRLDELPQLINVWRGEMSLVGPRPERPIFVQELRNNIPYYDLRYTVRPGITGWAQIRYRYAATEEESHVKLQYDLYYVKNLALSLDCRILIETARVVLLHEGAH